VLVLLGQYSHTRATAFDAFITAQIRVAVKERREIGCSSPMVGVIWCAVNRHLTEIAKSMQ
jgi:hypothetical protein